MGEGGHNDEPKPKSLGQDHDLSSQDAASTRLQYCTREMVQVLRMATPVVIDLTSDEPCGRATARQAPEVVNRHPTMGSSGAVGAARKPLQVVNREAIAKQQPAAAAKRKAAAVAKKQKAHALLWVPHNGTKSKGWSRLKVMGVYGTKEQAMAERERVMSRYDQCGHGDILIGPSWDDEIDLVVKPTECFFGDDHA